MGAYHQHFHHFIIDCPGQYEYLKSKIGNDLKIIIDNGLKEMYPRLNTDDHDLLSSYLLKIIILFQIQYNITDLNSFNNELIETKSKLPKKQNFIQKVFNVKPDSIEVTTLDTIQK